MLTIPDRISMDELSNLWILRALQELDATAGLDEALDLDGLDSTLDDEERLDGES